MKNLAQEIEVLNKTLADQLPTETIEAFGRAIEDLKSRDVGVQSLQIGERFPDFSLPNTVGEQICLSDLLKKGKVIVAFFRGSWCPYCNLQLRALQRELKEIVRKEASLIAVSPQMTTFNTDIKTSEQLTFDLLTDKGNTLASKLGINFELQQEVIPHYNSLGIDLTQYHEEGDAKLPVPAVFAVGTDGIITYKFADSNYMNRVDIRDLLNQL